MALLEKLDNTLILGRLGADFLGEWLRGVVTKDGAFHKHTLVRRFHPKFGASGKFGDIGECEALADRFHGDGVGKGFVFHDGDTPAVEMDYTVGFPLAEVLTHARKTNQPIPATVIGRVANVVGKGLIALHQGGQGHGLLGPHSIRLGVDGAVQMVDAPYAIYLKRKQCAVPPFANHLDHGTDHGMTPFQADLFALGKIIFLMATVNESATSSIEVARRRLETPPPRDFGPERRQGDRGQAESVEVNDERRGGGQVAILMERLLWKAPPIESIDEFAKALARLGEKVEYSFDASGYVQKLFKKEVEREQSTVELEQGFQYDLIRGAVEHVEPPPVLELAPPKRALRLGMGLALVSLVGVLMTAGGVYLKRRSERIEVEQAQEELRKKVTELAQLREELARKMEEAAKASARRVSEEQVAKQEVVAARTAADKALKRQRLETLRLGHQSELEGFRREIASGRQSVETKKSEIRDLVAKAPDTPQGLAVKTQAQREVEAADKTRAKAAEAEKETVAQLTNIYNERMKEKGLQAMSQPATEFVAGQPNPVDMPGLRRPTYPSIDRETYGKYGGQIVRIAVVVTPTGQVKNISVLQGIAGLDQAFREAAQQSSYNPAKHNGTPVETAMEVQYAIANNGVQITSILK